MAKICRRSGERIFSRSRRLPERPRYSRPDPSDGARIRGWRRRPPVAWTARKYRQARMGKCARRSVLGLRLSRERRPGIARRSQVRRSRLSVKARPPESRPLQLVWRSWPEFSIFLFALVDLLGEVIRHADL